MTSIALTDLVRCMAESMVERPESVRVEAIESSSSVVIEVECDASDIKHLVGRQGQTATAMRKILSTAARKFNKRTILEILE